MAAFDLKRWLDDHVVPLTKRAIPLNIYSFIWNGDPPKEMLVWVHAGTSPASASAEGEASFSESDVDFDPHAWPRAVKQLIEEDNFRFDFLREQIMVALPEGTISVFGGDGAPLFNKHGMASARLFRKEEDGVGLILQVGCQYPSGEEAAAATKSFYGQFEESPLELCQKFGTVFGQA
jgi:hypothetical protein